MSRTPPERLGTLRRSAAIALIAVAALLVTDFEALAHRHGGAWAASGQTAAIPSAGGIDAERPCSICRLADTISQAAADPVRVAAPLLVPDDPFPMVAFLIRTGPEPVRSSRAPPVSPSC